MRLWRFAAAMLAATMGAEGTASAGKSDDTLVWTGRMEPPNISSYANNMREGVILGFHIWDGLLYRDDETGEFRPHLAKSVKYRDALTIEIELRDDVQFHNGDKMTAEDVAWTVNYFNTPEAKNISPTRLNWIKTAETTGPHSVVFRLPEPFPAAMAYLANNVLIYPKAYYEKVGADGYARAPVGTGPYKVAEVSPGKRVVLVKNERYFGGAKGQPTIGTVIYRPIAEQNTQIAEFMTGQVNWMWQLQPDQAKRLEGRKGTKVMGGATMRIGYLTFDAAGRTGDHPMRNLKVRQAIGHAVDRKAIVDTLRPPGAKVTNLACYPDQFGCEAPNAPTYDYDPAKAKRMLAEAGYPSGFAVDFYGYRERPIAEAVIGYLQAVGITAKLQWMQYSPLRDKIRGEGVPFAFLTWGSGSIPDVAAITSVFFKNTADDLARDKALIAMLERGDSSLEPADRKKAYAEALTRIAEQAYWLPLYADSHYYVFTDQLDFTPSSDEVPRFFNARWK